MFCAEGVIYVKERWCRNPGSVSRKIPIFDWLDWHYHGRLRPLVNDALPTAQSPADSSIAVKVDEDSLACSAWDAHEGVQSQSSSRK